MRPRRAGIPTTTTAASQGGGARAAVFGVSDGLVTNVSLILGIAGAHPAAGVRPAGRRGRAGGRRLLHGGRRVRLDAGPDASCFERELALERHEIRTGPKGERRELVRIYESRGIEPAVAGHAGRRDDARPGAGPRDPRPRGARHQPALARLAVAGGGVVVRHLRRRGARCPDPVADRQRGTGAIVASVVIGARRRRRSWVRRWPSSPAARWWWSALRQLDGRGHGRRGHLRDRHGRGRRRTH